MGRDRSNKFRSAVRHLKSNQIDEKLELLSEIPTNNIGNLYSIEPEFITQDPDVPGEVTREADFTQDDSASDTTGLFDDDGTILTIEPPITADSPDRSYILGPMASMWYAWGNFTQIGYIRESDRKMVNLGRITGQLQNWDKVNGFTSYGQLTLEQAVWFCETPKYLNGYDNYRAFYPGPPSNTPDEFGRYYCTITGTTKPTTITPPPRRVPPVQGGPNAAGYPSWGNNPPPPPERGAPHDLAGNLILLGISAALAVGLTAALAKAGVVAGVNALVPKVVNVLKNLKPKPTYRPTKVKYPTTPKSKFKVEPQPPANRPPSYSRGRGMGDRWEGPLSNSYQPNGELISEGLEELPVELIPIIHNILVDMGGYTSENIDKLIKVIEKYSKPIKESREVISESRKRILRDIKKPYVLPEVKQEKYKFKKLDKVRAKHGRTINSDLMKQAEVPSSFKKADDRLWGKFEQEKNAKNSQDKKNVVLDHLGGGDHFLEYVYENGKQKNQISYEMFGGKAPKKVVRKEQLKGDTLLFIADENGKKESILQSEINDKLDQEFNKELFEKYFEEQTTEKPLFREITKRVNKGSK